MIIKLDIPEKVSTNTIYAGGIHWHKRKDLADLYHLSLYPHKNHKVQKYPIEITYRFTFKGKILDTTNCTYMAKLLEDGMVANMILENDDTLHVKGTHIYAKKGKKDTVEIELSPS